MGDFWESIADAMTELGTTGVIDVLILGLALSLCLSGLYLLCRRKVSDVFPLLVGLMFVGSVASMAVAAGFVRRADRISRTSQGPFNGLTFNGMAPSGWDEHASERQFFDEPSVSRLTSPGRSNSTAPNGSLEMR